MSEQIVPGLMNPEINPDSYISREKFQEHFFEQYKLYVEMADKISERRTSANTFFLTVNTFILGAIGFLYEKGPQNQNAVMLIAFGAALLALCYTWYRLIKSYRQLNGAKYKVVGEMERHLPSSPYWSAEWQSLGQGKDSQLYTPFTHLESLLPGVFAVLHVLAIAGLLVK